MTERLEQEKANSQRKIKDPLWFPWDSIIFHITKQQAVASRCALWREPLQWAGAWFQAPADGHCSWSYIWYGGISQALNHIYFPPSSSIYDSLTSEHRNENTWGRWSQDSAFYVTVNDATRWGFSVKRCFGSQMMLPQHGHMSMSTNCKQCVNSVEWSMLLNRW